MEIEYYELQRLLTQASELGAQRALIAVGKLKPFISKQEAYKQYGRGTIDRWIKEKQIILIQDGKSSNYRIDRMKLEVVAKASNRTTYLTTSERIE